MTAHYIGIDLGTTNIKAALYDGDMRLVRRESTPVSYLREQGFVEFDAEGYFDGLIELLNRVTGHGEAPVAAMALTGQAETLVPLGEDGRPVMNAISWMDERSTAECAALGGIFSPEEVERVTGQLAMLPTWPATKVLWLKKHRPEAYAATRQWMLLKDYIVYRLTGRAMADMSIATFSLWFDIYNKKEWLPMMDAAGVKKDALPPYCEPCSDAGALKKDVAEALGLPDGVRVNVGTLDHFAGMIGTGNVSPGRVTLSTGTVMALATFAAEPVDRNGGVAMHYGFLPDSHIMLPVAESGGVSLEWFRRSCLGGMDYGELNRLLAGRTPERLLFLPNIVGTNAPRFDAEACGAFFGLRQENDAVDMAWAVMAGVACLLRENCDRMTELGASLEGIIATGGGSASAIWCQLQADLTGLPVSVPEEREAACLGAAMIAAVSDGRFPSFEAAAAHCVKMARRYEPNPRFDTEGYYRRWRKFYDAALEIAKM